MSHFSVKNKSAPLTKYRTNIYVRVLTFSYNNPIWYVWVVVQGRDGSGLDWFVLSSGIDRGPGQRHLQPHAELLAAAALDHRTLVLSERLRLGHPVYREQPPDLLQTVGQGAGRRVPAAQHRLKCYGVVYSACWVSGSRQEGTCSTTQSKVLRCCL